MSGVLCLPAMAMILKPKRPKKPRPIAIQNTASKHGGGSPAGPGPHHKLLLHGAVLLDHLHALLHHGAVLHLGGGRGKVGAAVRERWRGSQGEAQLCDAKS